jgi:hypothetical protein
MGGALPGPAGGGGCTSCASCIYAALLLSPLVIAEWLDSGWGFLVMSCLYASLFAWGIRMWWQKRKAKPVDVVAAQVPKVVGGLMRLGGAPAKRPPPT